MCLRDLLSSITTGGFGSWPERSISSVHVLVFARQILHRVRHLFAGSVIFFLVAAGLLVREFMFLATWPEVDAIVTETHVIEESSGPNGHPLYRSQIDVRYDLEGVAAQGRAVSTYWTGDRAQAQ